MRPHYNAALFRKAHGTSHYGRIGGMKAAGHIGGIDQGHDRIVVAHLVQPERFAHVAIDLDHVSASPMRQSADVRRPTNGLLLT
jgi:hypothetical protein